MAVTSIARIQHRRGIKADLPTNLNEGELGWCMDTLELFIGNTPAVGGNTQILTSSENLVATIPYTFVSDTSVVSQTGSSLSQPVVRSLQQQMDDYWVNVKAYGAQGDGITDDTSAINQAIQDLYTKTLTNTENIAQSRKAIWFPSGVYLVSSVINLYPFVKLVGENTLNTEIRLVDGVLPSTVIMQTVDSLGQSGSNIGTNGAVLPQHITVCNLNLHFEDGVQAVLIQRAHDITFDYCVIQGNWVTGASPVTRGVVVETLGSAITTENIKFNNCIIQDVVQGYFCQDEAEHVNFENCLFVNMFKGMLLDNRVAPDPNPNSGPKYTRVVNTRFQDISDFGIQVMSPNPGITSMGNLFSNVGITSGVTPVWFDAVSTLCTSMGDVFDVVPGVQDNGTISLIADAQQNNFVSASSLALQVSSTTANALFYPTLSGVTDGTDNINTDVNFVYNPSQNALGIGTTSPTSNLHVVGTGMFTSVLTTAGRIKNLRRITAAGAVTVTATDDVIAIAQTVGAAITVNLPASPETGRSYSIKDGKGDALTNNITVEPDGAGTIDGAGNFVINVNYGSVDVTWDGVQWLIV